MEKNIYEFNDLSMGNARIDKDNKTITGVSIMSTNKSQNGRLYESKSLNSLVNIINKDMSKCFLNHESNIKKTGSDGGVRDLRDFVGHFFNARTDGKNTVSGDLKCAGQHWNLISDLAESAAPVGMSIAVSAHTAKKDGVEVIEDIGRVYSVDCVSTPAMTFKLLESIKNKDGEFDLDEAIKQFLGVKVVDADAVQEFLKYKRRI